MTKADIVNEISRKTGISREDVLKTLETFMQTVKGSMVKGENVYLRTFGSLQRLPVILRKILPSRFLLTKFRHSNHQRNLPTR